MFLNVRIKKQQIRQEKINDDLEITVPRKNNDIDLLPKNPEKR